MQIVAILKPYVVSIGYYPGLMLGLVAILGLDVLVAWTGSRRFSGRGFVETLIGVASVWGFLAAVFISLDRTLAGFDSGPWMFLGTLAAFGFTITASAVILLVLGRKRRARVGF